jgi:hypothetical protein
MARRIRNLIFALFVGVAATVLPATLQPQFKAGSVPDGLCELMLLPGSSSLVP